MGHRPDGGLWPAAGTSGNGARSWAPTAGDRAAGTPVGDLPTGVKATLLVTMTLTDLLARTGTATTLGPPGAGIRIGAETARRLACDAGVIPLVLGSRGEILDLGRQSRLFTLAQTKALWFRDRHCSFPDCDIPPFYCDAHHLLHWADGGPTNLANAALLCGAHHATVHRDQLTGHVHPDGTGVHWNLTPGSYSSPVRPAGTA